jgi:hypothetical protein
MAAVVRNRDTVMEVTRNDDEMFLIAHYAVILRPVLDARPSSERGRQVAPSAIRKPISVVRFATRSSSAP